MKSNVHPRLVREQKTVEAMTGLYCRDQHNTGNGLCPDCQALAEYARSRLQNCPFQETKTTCAKCPVHCYKPEMKRSIKAVMRYAGPRMLYRHPLMAIQHLLDGLGKTTVQRQKPASTHHKEVKT